MTDIEDNEPNFVPPEPEPDWLTRLPDQWMAEADEHTRNGDHALAVGFHEAAIQLTAAIRENARPEPVAVQSEAERVHDNIAAAHAEYKTLQQDPLLLQAINSPGIRNLIEERKRQLSEYSQEQDLHSNRLNELPKAAIVYLAAPLNSIKNLFWPWMRPPKFTPDDRIRELRKAGALVAAEIDRLTLLEASRSSRP